MATIQYNDAAFRALFPPYADPAKYPQATILNYWNMGTAYISNRSGGAFCGGMNLQRQTLALQLMTAHLLFIAGLIAIGQVPAPVTAAGIDKINVTLEPPPAKNMWQYWLSSSPYGQELLALLSVAGVGGFFIGGKPVYPAFKR
jgi:hypothetical protein